jgi:hypothetical protein
MAIARMSSPADPFKGGWFGKDKQAQERKENIGIIQRGLDNPKVSNETVREMAKEILKRAPEAAFPIETRRKED